MQPTNNLRVGEMVRLLSPGAIKSELPMSESANQTVVAGRDAVQNILRQQDPRVLVIVGPCSIHDTEGALDYARRLNQLRVEFADVFCVLMRVYFEKPRTTIGWKGLVNDPHLDGTYDIATGLSRARALLLAITELGLPTATEFLDPIVPQYLADLVSWPPSARVPPNPKRIAKWPAASPCRSDSRMAPTAPCKPPSMPWAPPGTPTVSSASTRTA